ncbi:MAG TPA: esterase-like activity of phytase family protein [Micropepsaceae bacterium]|nr:esterase-like activity of phytase family protein [Micropepsaceae bacterium]
MKSRSLSVFALAFVLACSAFGLAAENGSEAPTVHSTRIPLYPATPGERRAGALIYRGGLVLTSSDRAFGGWSDLGVSADGSEILAISDEAHWLRAHLSYDSNGDLASASDGEVAPMLDMQGRPMIGKDGDAEGLTLEHPNDVHGTVAVSFERDVRVWRYDVSHGFDAKPTNVPIGNWVKPLHDNEQLEAITLYKPDTLLAFAETKVNPGDDLLAAMEAYPNPGGQPSTRMLSVVPHDPFAITSVATAPDGGLYLLERRFSILGGVGMELRHIPAEEVHEGARMNGEVLANLSFQDTNIDNMEGLALRRGPKGETLLYIISDDNYSPLQRTLLLMFEVKNGG